MAMNKKSIMVAALAVTALTAQAQTSGMTERGTTDKAHITIPFSIDDPGTKLRDIQWGLDQAWIWDQNLLRGISFAGQDLIGIVRISFQPSHSLESGDLSFAQKTALDMRIRIAKMTDCKTVNLNSDPQEGKAVDAWYKTGNAATNGARWALLIALTKRYVEQRGLKVVSVSPFNEPDYADWKQGTKDDFREICKQLRENDAYKEEFKDIALCGGNTLNNDCAKEWYDHSKEYLDEGNTHQLAGSFDSFVDFYKQVNAEGKVSVADELHNIMEAMVASNYGLDKGIWWGTAEHVRSQFMKATRGTRLGYGESRSQWVAGSVYRHTDGSVQGFVATSERQAQPAVTRFVALDHDVFYNGYGPTREYMVSTPGIPSSVSNKYDALGKYCRNPEILVNIQSGEDIMPPMPMEETTVKIMSRVSGYLLSPFENEAALNKRVAQQRQLTPNRKEHHWTMKPQDIDMGNDFFYYTFTNQGTGQYRMGCDRWTIDDKSSVYLSENTDTAGVHHQWCLSYAGDGYFYIRNRQSGMYLQVSPSDLDADYKDNKRTVNQGVFTGGAHQQWRLIAENTRVDQTAPKAPQNLTTLSRPASVRLSWKAPADRDIKHYCILRSTDAQTWYTIHNSLIDTIYVDNTVEPATTYYYKVQAVDQSLNRSNDSEVVQAAVTGEKACVMRLSCDSLMDNTWNGNHAIYHGSFITNQTIAKEGRSLYMRSASSNFIQLPPTVASSKDLTFAAWVRMNSDQQWSRIFDFGNDENHYVFLTPRNSYTGNLRLAIKNGAEEQTLDYSKPLAKNQWAHVAVTFAEDGVTLYLNGEAVASSTTMTLRPADFKPVLNYVGRSQFFSDPMLDAYVDDIRIYNYALSADEIVAVKDFTDDFSKNVKNGDGNEDLTAIRSFHAASSADARLYDLQGRPVGPGYKTPGVYVSQGRKVLVK